MEWHKKTGQWPVLPKMVLTISQDSVLTLLKCDVIFNDDCYKFAIECDGGEFWKSVGIQWNCGQE